MTKNGLQGTFFETSEPWSQWRFASSNNSFPNNFATLATVKHQSTDIRYRTGTFFRTKK